MTEERRRSAALALLDRVSLNPPADRRQAAWVGYALAGIALCDDPARLAEAERIALEGR